MDVLAYSLSNQQVQLNREITQKTTCLSTKCSETVAAQAVLDPIKCWVQCIEPCLLRCPHATSFWSCIPDLTGATLGFKVCDTGLQFNLGATCSWTVPNGVTRARFQIWGAGGGSGAGCCCGGSAFGSTGAYASVIIPVTAGSVYTLCSGCAAYTLTCTTNATIGRIPGCPSWVAGAGLCNFCANGGQGRMGTWMAAYGQICQCRIFSMAAGYSVCGPFLCNCGVDYCYCGAACSGGIIPHVPGASYFGTTTSETSPSIVYGIRGMWECTCIYNYGGICHQHPPIYGFPTTSCCGVYYNGICCGVTRSGCCGYLNIPGAGAAPSNATGGANGIFADPAGRMGMVCVTYC